MKSTTPDAAALELFARQHRYARVQQLYEIGLTKHQIAHRIRKGMYTREAYGVVALVQPEPTFAARAIRGVFIAGRSAVAALWTAAELHRLDAPRDHQIHVVVRGNSRRKPSPDLYVHRTRYLPASHIQEIDAIPTTSLSRTIIDCSSHLDRWSALALLDSCSASPAVWRQIHRTALRLSNGRAGVRVVIEATAPDGAERMRSMLERIAREALRARGVPDGEWNRVIADERGPIREVDLVYADARLIVEFDGLRFHRGRSAEQRDRATDRRLQAMGWRIFRFTWEDVTRRPAAVAHDIMRALSIH